MMNYQELSRVFGADAAGYLQGRVRSFARRHAELDPEDVQMSLVLFLLEQEAAYEAAGPNGEDDGTEHACMLRRKRWIKDASCALARQLFAERRVFAPAREKREPDLSPADVAARLRQERMHYEVAVAREELQERDQKFTDMLMKGSSPAWARRVLRMSRYEERSLCQWWARRLAEYAPARDPAASSDDERTFDWPMAA